MFVHRRSGLQRRLRARPATGRHLRLPSATRLGSSLATRHRPGTVPARSRRPATHQRSGSVPANQAVRQPTRHLLGRRPGSRLAASRRGRCPRRRLQHPRGERRSLRPLLLPSPPHPWIHLHRHRICQSPEPPFHLASRAAVRPWRRRMELTSSPCGLQSVMQKEIRLGGETMADCCNFLRTLGAKGYHVC